MTAVLLIAALACFIFAGYLYWKRKKMEQFFEHIPEHPTDDDRKFFDEVVKKVKKNKTYTYLAILLALVCIVISIIVK